MELLLLDTEKRDHTRAWVQTGMWQLISQVTGIDLIAMTHPRCQLNTLTRYHKLDCVS